MHTRGVWLDAPLTPLAAWLTEPNRACGLGVVVLPPVGYASSSSHRLWRRLAESLAQHGAVVIRVDLAGCGDSAGRLADVRDIGEWRTALPTAASFLRDGGTTRLAVIGCQLGAALALLDAVEIGADGLVTVAPVLSGRTFVRSLRVTALRPPVEIGGLALGGHHFSAALLGQLADLRVSPPNGLPLLEIPDGPAVAAVLERPAEEAEVDEGLVTQVTEWVRALAPDQPRVNPSADNSPTEARLRHGDVDILEEFVTVGPDRLAGVLTSAGHEATAGLLILINSGSDPHTGPGRAWAELARALGARGRNTLRVDLRGWGESPDGPTTPGRPYDEHAVGDVIRLVDGLRDHGPIILSGLCAGAWVSLAAAREVDVAGVIALNPQLYWQPGDPVEALMSTTRERRREEIAAIRRDADAGRWDAEDIAGQRPPAGAWLDDLVRLRRPASLLFAEGDDGLEYLRDRLGRRLRVAVASGLVTVTELIGVDHGLHRTWLRPAVYAAIATELDRILDRVSGP